MNEIFATGVILYALCNGFAFFAFAVDKRAAEKNRWRFSERFLLFSALAGPLGACCAMKFFRHKTRALKFYLVPFFLFLHIIIIASVLYSFLSIAG
jgi:uncharacterized membrane protein YsdA (DUF1294 family)